MMIKILVEGDGDERALPLLVRKQYRHIQIDCIDMGGKSNIVRIEDGFEQTIRRQKALDFSNFIVLMDRDVRFPPYDTLEEERIGMTERCRVLAANENVTIRIFWAIRMIESWIIGGLEKGDHFCGITTPLNMPVSGDTQAYPEHPKEWIIERLADHRYNPDDLVCLTRHINLGGARDRNQSLRIFLDALQD